MYVSDGNMDIKMEQLPSDVLESGVTICQRNMRHVLRTNEPQHDKTNKMTCASSEDSDLILVFAGRTGHFVGFVMLQLTYLQSIRQESKFCIERA